MNPHQKAGDVSLLTRQWPLATGCSPIVSPASRPQHPRRCRSQNRHTHTHLGEPPPFKTVVQAAPDPAQPPRRSTRLPSIQLYPSPPPPLPPIAPSKKPALKLTPPPKNAMRGLYNIFICWGQVRLMCAYPHFVKDVLIYETCDFGLWVTNRGGLPGANLLDRHFQREDGHRARPL